MTEYEEIKNSLSPTFERFGLMLEQEENHPDEFGSAFSIYSGNGLKYRILWDGKDGCGYIQNHKSGEWVTLSVNAPESDTAAFKDAVLRMRIALSEHIAMAKLNA